MSNTISQNLHRLEIAREDIATAITNKGVIVPSGSGFEDYSSLIDSIPSAGGGYEILPQSRTKPSMNLKVRDTYYRYFETKKWTGLTSFPGSNVWTDGKIYIIQVN